MLKYLALLFMILPVVLLEAQIAQGMIGGVSLNVNYMIENKNSSLSNEILPPPDLSVYLGYDFNNFFTANFYADYNSFADNWDGLELGAAFKYMVINNLFASGGFSYAFISGGNDSPGNNPLILVKRNFTYLNIGAEYFLSKISFVELIYSKPVDKNTVYGYDSYGNNILSLSGKIKLGFGFNFSL